MATFDGTRIEVHDELWGEDQDGETEFGRTLSVWGRTASGTWLSPDDARGDLNAEDVDILVENDGSISVSSDGQDWVVNRLAEAFPGAEIHYYDDLVDEGELDVTGVRPVFEIEWLMGRLATD